MSEEGSSLVLTTEILEEAEKEISILKETIIRGFKDPNQTSTFLKHKLKNLSEVDTQGLRTSIADCENILEPILNLKNFMNQKAHDLKQAR